MAFILIVGGDEGASQRAADALSSADHACAWVGDASAARTLLRWRSPDLILFDDDTRGMSVEGLLDALDPASDLPVITLSTTTGAGPGSSKIVHGVQDCIRKPFDPRFLVWRVNHALEAKAVRSQAGERTAGRAMGGDRRFSIA